jgi:hypothetical protein
MAAFLGKDVKKLKAKGGGKWKYLSEKEMLDYSARFAPYRYLASVSRPVNLDCANRMKELVHVVHVAGRGCEYRGDGKGIDGG